MVRENLFIYLVEGFIGLVFTLYALGVLMPVIVLYENGFFPLSFSYGSFFSIVLTAVVFFVGIASFAGIPVLRKSSAKGIKLFVIISVIQIGTIISCWIFKAPGMGGPSLGDDLLGKELEGIGLFLGLPLAVLFILVIALRRL